MNKAKADTLTYYIIGTTHRDQASDAGLQKRMQRVCLDYDVRLIAEEVDPRKLASVGRGVASSKQTPWRCIEMTAQEQRDASIFDDLENAAAVMRQNPSRNVYPVRANAIRENFWLDKIEEECRNNSISHGVVLVTCGRNHLEFLAGKARDRHVVVIEEEYPIGLKKKLPMLELLQ